MVNVVVQLKKDNDQYTVALRTGQRQLNELFGSVTDLVLDRAITIPIAGRTLRQIEDFFAGLNTAAEINKITAQFIARQARESGYYGVEVTEEIAAIEQRLADAKAKQSECVKLREQLKVSTNEAKQARQEARQEAEEQLEAIRSQLDEMQRQVQSLNEVKANLVLLKAGGKYNEKLLRRELTDAEQSKVGLRPR
jgi:chromosome segregation ATPase